MLLLSTVFVKHWWSSCNNLADCAIPELGLQAFPLCSSTHRSETCLRFRGGLTGTMAGAKLLAHGADSTKSEFAYCDARRNGGLIA